ncbi:MAG TPA: sulfocyanin-like copper-binding protein, partial [Candidatus Dormibacteraeota bacterium]
ASRTAVLTLIAGYPSGSTAFNYNGYSAGGLELTLPAGWTLQVQCENRSTVPNSCAVVSDRRATAPVDAAWSTHNPVRGLPAGDSESFAFSPPAPADYRIASLVPGSEASGMWMLVHAVAAGEPRITGTAAPNSCATC